MSDAMADVLCEGFEWEREQREELARAVSDLWREVASVGPLEMLRRITVNDLWCNETAALAFVANNCGVWVDRRAIAANLARCDRDDHAK